MAGMLSKKENWAARARPMPRARAAAMVEPLREMPGVMAMSCARPIKSARPRGGGRSAGSSGDSRRCEKARAAEVSNRATPTARVRVAPSDTGIVGYAVGGRAGTVGYLQRLAVRPSHQGHGLGRSLVMDSLRWMRRRGANHALVNTQMANERAFGLYLALGFRPEPHDLAVLEAELGPSV